MEEMERAWTGMFRRNAVAHAQLHSHLSSYDRILSTYLLPHRIPPPPWLPDPPPPPPLSPSPHVLDLQTSSLQPQQPAVVLASQRDAGLGMANGHKHEQDNDERRVCANGIPNTINKYKEDQRIVWHGTPFEERVEKALSDEKLFPRNQDQI